MLKTSYIHTAILQITVQKEITITSVKR